ncbi:MAG: 50S ribosomal protein L11 methyltransferase [Acidobacteriota bacterium]
MKTKLSAEFLTKRRHRRQAPAFVCLIGERFQLCYGPPFNTGETELTTRLIIRLSASVPSAFGSVSLHQTTQWCLQALEKYYQGGRLLDVGTGNGLLAICAARLAQWQGHDFKIEAFDVYRDAVHQARINLRLNGLDREIQLRQGILSDYPTRSYQNVVVNLPPVIIPLLLHDLMEMVVPRGILILSGFLHHDLVRISECFRNAGFTILETISTDLWCMLVTQLAS